MGEIWDCNVSPVCWSFCEFQFIQPLEASDFCMLSPRNRFFLTRLKGDGRKFCTCTKKICLKNSKNRDFFQQNANDRNENLRKTQSTWFIIYFSQSISDSFLGFCTFLMLKTAFSVFFLACLRISTNENDVRHVKWIKNDWNESSGRLSRKFCRRTKNFDCACHVSYEAAKHKRTNIWLCSVNKRIA